MRDEKPALLREFTLKGLWWFPGNHDKKLWGILKYSPSDGLVLELMGDIKNTIILQPIILGMGIDGRHITLIKCHHRGDFGSLSDGTLKINIYTIYIVLFGIHYYKIEDIKINKLSIHYSNLDEWLNIPILSIHCDKYEYRINYKPKLMEASLNNDWKLIINIAPDIKQKSKTVAIFKQKSFIELESAIERPLDDFIALLKTFRNFMSFALIEPVNPLIIRGEIKKDHLNEGKMVNIWIDILISNVLYENMLEVKYKYPLRMLFTFKDIEDNYDFILRNWFEKASQYKLCFDIYFSILYNPDICLEHEFIILFQSFESYLQHKKNSKINMKNELNDIIKKYSIINEGIINCDAQFINKVIITRQYLIHSDYKKEIKSIKAGDLYPIIQKLRILLMAILLVETGFSIENVKKLFDKNIKIKRLIELELIKCDF